MNALKNLLAVIAGFIAGSLVNMALVMIGPRVVPPPAGVDMAKIESIHASLHLFEPQHFAFPFLAHACGTLVGALVTFLAARSFRTVLGFLIAVLFLGGGIAAALMIPAPKWFIALDLLVAYLPMAWIATRLGRRIKGEDPASTVTGG